MSGPNLILKEKLWRSENKALQNLTIKAKRVNFKKKMVNEYKKDTAIFRYIPILLL